MKLGKLARKVRWRQICIFVASIVLAAESRSNQATDTDDIAVLMRPPKLGVRSRLGNLGPQNFPFITLTTSGRLVLLLTCLNLLLQPTAVQA